MRIHNNIIAWLLVGSISLLMTACSDDVEAPAPSPLKVTESTVNFSSEGGEGKIDVTSSTPIASAVSSDDWCEVTNIGDYTVSLNVAQCKDLDGRNAIVTIVDQNNNVVRVPVSQSGILFQLGSRFAGFSDDGGSQSIWVKHDNDVSVACSANWVNASVVGDSIVVTTRRNTTRDMREAVLEVTSGNRTDTIRVAQADISDLAGNYYFTGTNSLGETQATPATIEAVDDTTLRISFTEYDYTCDVKYDSENMKMIFRAGMKLAAYKPEQYILYFVFTTLSDARLRVTAWGETASMDGNFSHGDYGTRCVFVDNGSISGYTMAAINFDVFSGPTPRSNNYVGNTILSLINPALYKMW